MPLYAPPMATFPVRNAATIKLITTRTPIAGPAGLNASPGFVGCHVPADRRQRTGSPCLPEFALHHGRAPQGRHILTDGPVSLHLPDDVDERPTLVGQRR